MGRHEEALKILHGGTVIPAIPLVLDENRKFNEAGQRTLIRYYLDAGVGGLAVAVHTTQFEIRKPEVGLFEPVLRVTKEEMDAYEARTGKTLVRVAGACGEAEQACAEARTAKALGFDAVLLSPGGLAHRTEEELVERTHAVAAEMPVIGFYLQTACGGRRLSYEYWKAVADTPGVVAIKCASFNRYQSIDLVRGVAYSARREEIALYTGNDDNIVADLLTPYRFPVDGKEVELRFVGGLLGHWSVWTHSVVKLYEELREYRDGRDIPAELLARGAAVTDCNGVFFDVAHNFAGCIPGVHEVLRRQGLMAGTWCLDPDETLSEGQEQEISRVYEMYPHLNDDAFVALNLKDWMACNAGRGEKYETDKGTACDAGDAVRDPRRGAGAPEHRGHAGGRRRCGLCAASAHQDP